MFAGDKLIYELGDPESKLVQRLSARRLEAFEGKERSSHLGEKIIPPLSFQLAKVQLP
jgi:hypothetical protein